MPSPAVAVIDIGSNTIKVLVARTAADGALQTELFQSIDARISTGISRARPELSREGMDRGIAAIRQLLASAAPVPVPLDDRVSASFTTGPGAPTPRITDRRRRRSAP